MLCCPYCSQLSKILKILFSIVTPDPGSTILFNIVDNYEQYGQHNIVQSCYTADSEVLGVYWVGCESEPLIPRGGENVGGGGGSGVRACL